MGSLTKLRPSGSKTSSFGHTNHYCHLAIMHSKAHACFKVIF
jgi:hypothetical protein